MNLSNKLTVFQKTVCETVATKVFTFQKIQDGSLSYLSFLIMHLGGISSKIIKQRIIFLKVLGY